MGTIFSKMTLLFSSRFGETCKILLCDAYMIFLTSRNMPHINAFSY